MTLFKLLVILMLLSVLWALGSGLYFLLTDRGHGERTVRALTWRIGLSVALFLLLLIGAALGWIDPHGVR